MRGIRLYAIVAAAFMAGAFIASPELRAYAANTVGSADIINNTIQSVDIKDGEVKTADLANNAVTSAKIKDDEVKAAEIASNAVGAAEIAANAVGASEIAGVGNLIFAECTHTNTNPWAPGLGLTVSCDAEGAGSGDVAIATVSKGGNTCFSVTQAAIFTDWVHVSMRNNCNANALLGTANIAIIVFDTAGVFIPPI